MLSVIFPIRAEAGTAYLVERLAANLTLFGRYPDVECVVVDSASAPKFATEIRRLCDRPHVTYVVDPSPPSPFAPGYTRNLGAQAARGDYLLFYDVDLCCDATLVPAIERWCASAVDPCAFLMVPCLYANRTGTARLDFRGEPVDLQPLLASFLSGDTEYVDHIAVSTSTVVVARRHFLQIGGNRSAYVGHGCEDFDLLHRLVSYWPAGARPGDYYLSVRTRFPGDYRGFRAYLLSYALPHLYGGPITAHLWHPRPKLRRYWRNRQYNEGLLQSFMREHDSGSVVPQPLRSRVDDEPRGEPLPAPWTTSAPPPKRPRELIRELTVGAGRDPEVDIGLLRHKPGAKPPGNATRRKLRKLWNSPRRFFLDAKRPMLRRLARLFPR